MNIISLFSGCGGMDLGFEKAGFNIIWANDNSPGVWSTYSANFPDTVLERRSLSKLPSSEIPSNIVGIIGGPPCQSWSVAGNRLGIEDTRGRLFYDFIRVINDKKPHFFVAENVAGMVSKNNHSSYEKIKSMLEEAGDGYELSVKVLNANDYGVPQNRKRVFFVGYQKELNKKYTFPDVQNIKPTVRQAIGDLTDNAIPSAPGKGNQSNLGNCAFPNHEYWEGDYSYIFMSRNRVLSWDHPSYTVQASGRQTSLHPQAPFMEKVEKDVRRFVLGSEHLYRRLTVRECARLQTFPDNFQIIYNNLNTGYKMIGNSVPVSLAASIARPIFEDLAVLLKSDQKTKNITESFSITEIA